MPLLKGILHGRKITTDSGQQQDGGGGGLRRSNAVKHHGQQQQQQASAGGFDFPRREAVRTNTSPGLGSGGQAPMVAHARARATSSAAAQSGSEWSYVPANVQIRQHHGHGHSPGQREQLERRQELEDVHSQRTQRWVADQQKRMMLTPPVTRKPLPPQPPQSQSLPRPGGRPQIQQKPPQQQPQPTIPSSGSRRPFFKNDAELDDCVRSTSPPYEDGILNHGDWKTASLGFLCCMEKDSEGETFQNR
ncbi:uncharacterized protein BO72DRAFT_483752 [Aspergillus fijiensis CBS 313.89]|uniref:Uncharacterized protein n=1 Tax=Aspergillus fijiensis CBS 313.89 TaxID=1448319 RepID=A0A8G1RWT9_9EURO|nr:uncharacterized protein BO72DRAFT_483752 [Aspergillus fijiensis CBS 313.89]RAK80634.1 hypothetical protein BO72DRAFT_483752 [Aspergillus fijiensis CBS 313.89]